MTGTDRNATVVRVDQGRFGLRGELSFDTAGSLLRALRDALHDVRGAVVIDLADIQRADSAGVALLIELVRIANQRGIDLSFANLSPQVEVLSAVAGVDRLLPRRS